MKGTAFISWEIPDKFLEGSFALQGVLQIINDALSRYPDELKAVVEYCQEEDDDE